MLKIRLQRIGKRGQAYFRVAVTEHTKKPKGESLELLGSYDPHKKEFKVNQERIEYWISKGAGVSATVHNLLTNYKYWDKPKVTSWKAKSKSEAQAGEKKTEAAALAEPAPVEPAAETTEKEQAVSEAADPKTETAQG